MSDFLNPPLPPGGIVDGTINYSVLNGIASSGDGLPPLPPLSTLPGSDSSSSNSSAASAVTGAIASAVNPSSTPTTPSATSDSFVSKVAYLLLGVVIIAGAIWTYRK